MEELEKIALNELLKAVGIIIEKLEVIEEKLNESHEVATFDELSQK